MRIYRNSYCNKTDEGQHTGYSFHVSKADARSQAFTLKKAGVVVPKMTAEPLDFIATRKGIVKLLSTVASHPNNG